MDNYKHYSVLLKESINALEIDKNGIYVDATLGGGGHSLEILKRLDKGMVICFDQDGYAILKSKERLKDYLDKVIFVKSNFCYIKEELENLGIYKIDGIVYDLGVSSFQLDIPSRGFSYRFDSFLDMRMDQESSLTCKDIVNTYSLEELSRVFYKYGGSKYSRSVALNICKYRESKEILTTFELVDIIKSSLPYKELQKKGHPAKVFFQALRIEVNKELSVLDESLSKVIPMLNKNGIIVCITFQPDEDQIVMRHFKDVSRSKLPINLPIRNLVDVDYKIMKYDIKPSEDEILENNRSHSAKLRVLKRLYVNGC